MLVSIIKNLSFALALARFSAKQKSTCNFKLLFNMRWHYTEPNTLVTLQTESARELL
jgi:hypothetical protein